MKELILKRAVRLVSELSLPKSELTKIEKNLKDTYRFPEADLFTPAGFIDHTSLSFNTTEKEIENLCHEAHEYNFKAVCVNPVWVKKAFEERKRSGGKFLVATVVDFPLGASTETARVAEAKQALMDGADEIDLVISIGMVKSGNFKKSYDLIKCVNDLGVYLKVILETSALELKEKIDAALVSFFAGASMFKTSTGVNGQAYIEDVKLLRAIAGRSVGVKAAGGIKKKEDLVAMIAAGADRVGCSRSVSIIETWAEQ